MELMTSSATAPAFPYAFNSISVNFLTNYKEGFTRCSDRIIINENLTLDKIINVITNNGDMDNMASVSFHPLIKPRRSMLSFNKCFNKKKTPTNNHTTHDNGHYVYYCT
jgi:hypothetical protein